MKLSYRGISYDFNPSSLQYRGAKQRFTQKTAAKTLGAVLTYRGTSYAIASAEPEATVSAVPAGTVLTYRGISYTVQPTVAAPVAAPAPVAETVASVAVPATSLQERARQLTLNHHRAMKQRQQVMLSRSAAALGLPTTAASYWEQIQETFSPDLQATYDRSHAALS